MPAPIEDYALLSDTQSAALVARDGSIDWLTFPRFDSPACFAALLGDPSHGRWQIAPTGGVRRVSRRYRPGTLVLETTFETEDGVVRLVDAMPVRDGTLDLVRRVEGVSGRVPLREHLVVRPDYGSVVPWGRRVDGAHRFVAGPDALTHRGPCELAADGWSHHAELSVAAGETADFALAWHPSHVPPPPPIDVGRSLASTTEWWDGWSVGCTVAGEWAEVVTSSLVVLKGLIYAPTGGIVAAPTTSLPERIGGARNWDYRYCWLRDATFTLMSLMGAGYTEEAAAWRDWLLRAVAGRPDQAQIMYGCAGERRLPELTLDWLPGYEGSAPVRVGNAAHGQFQLDVYGEVLDALHQATESGVADSDRETGSIMATLADHVADIWSDPDDGIWETRGGRRHFTHSKVMAWVAIDRAIRSAARSGIDAPFDRWRAVRHEIHDDVLAHGVDDRGVLVQSYDSTALDASLLLVPLVGFLPGTDERVVRTVEAIQRELTEDGFVLRYRTEGSEAGASDGLPGGEGTFLLCSFWLADALVAIGRRDEAKALYERLVALRNDVGLLSEEWDPVAGRMLGNFPQAFSHTGLVETAFTLTEGRQGVRAPGPGDD